MYHMSPLRYLLEGLAITGISGARVSCSSIELLRIPLPPNRGTCGEYLAAYVQESPGTIISPHASGEDCEYCPVSEVDSVLDSLSMGSDKARAWRNLGLLAVYVVADVVAIFAIYYLARVTKKRRSK